MKVSGIFRFILLVAVLSSTQGCHWWNLFCHVSSVVRNAGGVINHFRTIGRTLTRIPNEISGLAGKFGSAKRSIETAVRHVTNIPHEVNRLNIPGKVQSGINSIKSIPGTLQRLPAIVLRKLKEAFNELFKLFGINNASDKMLSLAQGRCKLFQCLVKGINHLGKKSPLGFKVPAPRLPSFFRVICKFFQMIMGKTVLGKICGLSKNSGGARRMLYSVNEAHHLALTELAASNYTEPFWDIDPVPVPTFSQTNRTLFRNPGRYVSWVAPKGCWRDNASRVLKRLIHTHVVNPRVCAQKCKIAGFNYAGIQVGSQCFCGDVYKSLGRAHNCHYRSRNSPHGVRDGGGAWANSVYSAHPTLYKSLGCWRDNGSRVLKKHLIGGRHLSVQECVEGCKAKGYKYAGLQIATHCFCGNEYARLGRSNHCNAPAKGGPRGNRDGGGPWSNAVFSTQAKTYKNMGCWRDSAHRVMKMIGHTHGMSVEMCVSTCKSRGFKYAGLENSRECFCSHNQSYKRLGRAHNCYYSTPRDSPGNGNGGGPWALQVFATGMTPKRRPSTPSLAPGKPKAKAQDKNTCKPYATEYPTGWFFDRMGQNLPGFKITPDGKKARTDANLYALHYMIASGVRLIDVVLQIILDKETIVGKTTGISIAVEMLVAGIRELIVMPTPFWDTHDGLIDSAEIQATWKNTEKLMKNMCTMRNDLGKVAAKMKKRERMLLSDGSENMEVELAGIEKEMNQGAKWKSAQFDALSNRVGGFDNQIGNLTGRLQNIEGTLNVVLDKMTVMISEMEARAESA